MEKWTEKYRPTTLETCILPDRLRTQFQKALREEHIPDYIFAGNPGCGKTTVAAVLTNELGCDLLKIPASMRGNIDTLRTEILDYASTVSFSGKRKYVLLDEADRLSMAMQQGLRTFMDDYGKNCGFILTCNYPNGIIEPLHSRCTVLNFNAQPEERKKLAVDFFKRLIFILTNEKIKYDKNVLVSLIERYFGDWRRLINIIQEYDKPNNEIDTGIVTFSDHTNFDEMVRILKSKKWNDIRKWCAENAEKDFQPFVFKIYNHLFPLLKEESAAELITRVREHMYQSAFITNQEITLTSLLTEVMFSMSFA